MFEAAQPPTTPCAGAPLAREAVKLIRQLALYDGQAPQLFAAVEARLAMAEEAVSLVRATSREGLLFQACVACSAPADVQSWADKEGHAATAALVTRAEHALTSIVAALRTAEMEPLVGHYAGHVFRHELAA